MRNLLLISNLIFLCTSCFVHKGHRIDEQCRPKKPNFKLNKSFFNDSNKLIFNKIYIVDSHPKSFGYGFYSDGRLVFLHSKDGFELKSEDVFGIRWENAPAIGYWRFNGTKIETEYFSCSNSGDYIRKQGEIKGDTIVFERNCGTSNPFKTIKCPEKYILSDMSFE